MQAPVRQLTQPNSTTAEAGGPAFHAQLIAELDSTHQPSAAGTNTTVNPAHAGALSNTATGEDISAAAALADQPYGHLKADNQTPLYDRLYGTPPGLLSNDIGRLTNSADSVSTSRVREFADAIRSPASIAAIELGTTTNTVIAFAGLETGWGRHIPAAGGHSSHNLFGIKSNNNGPSVSSQTTEFIDGQPHSIAQQFRSYQSIGESIADFSRFLRTNPRYELALNHAGNPKRFIQLVHDAGYATDPDYANKVIGALEQLDTITRKTGAIGIGWK